MNQKVDGLLVSKWDKQSKSNAVLYFDESVKLYKVDGVDNLNPITKRPQELRGSGTVKKPGRVTAIPGGERTLSIAEGTGEPQDFKFDFVPKRFYQITVEKNLDRTNDVILEAQITEGLVDRDGNALITNQAQLAARGIEITLNVIDALDITVIDITGGKKRNSPSMVIRTPGEYRPGSGN